MMRSARKTPWLYSSHLIIRKIVLLVLTLNYLEILDLWFKMILEEKPLKKT